MLAYAVSLQLIFSLNIMVSVYIHIDTYNSLFILTVLYIQYTIIFIHFSIDMFYIHFAVISNCCMSMYICMHSLRQTSKGIGIFDYTRYSQIALTWYTNLYCHQQCMSFYFSSFSIILNIFRLLMSMNSSF